MSLGFYLFLESIFPSFDKFFSSLSSLQIILEIFGIFVYLIEYEIIPLDIVLIKVVFITFRLIEGALKAIIIDIKAAQGQESFVDIIHRSEIDVLYLLK